MKSFKTYLVNFLLVLFGIIIAFVIVEFVARKIDDGQSLKFIGKGGSYKQDDTLGFVLSPITKETISSEFHTYDSVNIDFMNDEPIELTSDET